MNNQHIEGKLFYCGDYVNTDVMAPGRFEPIEGEESLAKIALIDYEGQEPFINTHTNRSDFKVIVAGREFGCGSSRETAPQALYYAGVTIVIAKSFARIFFRNCINMGGIYPIKIEHDITEEDFGKSICVDLKNRLVTLGDSKYKFSDFGPLTQIIEAGGLSNYTNIMIAKGKQL